MINRLFLFRNEDYKSDILLKIQRFYKVKYRNRKAYKDTNKIDQKALRLHKDLDRSVYNPEKGKV